MTSKKDTAKEQELDIKELIERQRALQKIEAEQKRATVVYKDIISIRESIVESLISAKADDVTINIAENYLKQTRREASAYYAGQDFEGRRLKVALWSARQAQVRADKLIDRLDREAEAKAAEQANKAARPPSVQPSSLDAMISSAQTRSEQCAAQAEQGRFSPSRER